jgi:hypothetical protein
VIDLSRMIELAQRSVGEELMDDLYTWCHEGWEYNDERYDTGMQEYPHREMCEVFESVLPIPGHSKGQQLLMVNAPRGTFKSVCGVNGLASYFTVKWKLKYGIDTRTMIGRSSQDEANKALGAIKEAFTKPESRIAPLVADGVRNAFPWKSDAITLGWRSHVLTDPTICTTGLDVGNTGTHMDLIILDDLINETNFQSPRAIEYAWTKIQSMFPILEPNGTIIVIGTFWSPFDHSQKILQMNMEVEARNKDLPDEMKKPLPWKTYIRGAYREDEGHEGELYFKEKLNEAFLEQMRSKTDQKLYSCWYLNKIKPDENMVFRPSDLRFYDGKFDSDLDNDEPPTLSITSCGDTSLEKQDLRVRAYLLCDTAVTTSQRSNNTGLVLLLVDEKGRWFIHDAVKMRETPSHVIERIVGMTAQYENEITSIETVAANVMFADAVETAYRANNIRCKVVRFLPQQLKSEGVVLSKKSTRIEWLEPKFRRGEVFIMRGLRGFMRELETYDGVTREEHYDLLDALSQGIELAKKAKPQAWEEDREDRETRWHKEYTSNAKANKNLATGEVPIVGKRASIVR